MLNYLTGFHKYSGAKCYYNSSRMRTPGFSGDNGNALLASLNNPVAVAVDKGGNFYIADENNNRIRKVILGGPITTIAGGGAGGNGGPATGVALGRPDGVSVDDTGNVYVTEWVNDEVRKISPAGIITAYCGNGQQGCTGDNGPAINATMQIPNGSVTDAAGNVYTPDEGCSRIRKTNAATGIVTTFASGGLGSVAGLCLDGQGYLYASVGNQILKFNLNTGTSTVYAGNGNAGYTGDGHLATYATLASPQGLSVGPDGTLYIADEYNNVIRTVSYVEPIGYVINTLAGNGTAGFSGDNGPATSAQLFGPTGVFFYGTSDLYTADAGNNRIRKVILAVPKGTGLNTPGSNAETIYPNPSAGSFTLQVDAAIIGASFEIYDVAGRRVYSGEIAELQTKIDFPNQPAGVYTMRLSNGKVQRITITK